eukprot:Tbor_TRINITY_DN5290_c0_g2::TRINITY_DN5290_c0_g2_i2::g.16582::m.16582/K06966/K06966; uncharacterized protein
MSDPIINPAEDTGKLTLIVRITLKSEENTTDFINAFRDLFIHCTMREPGTTLYELHQSKSNPKVMIIMEKFSNQKAVEAHQSSEEYKAFVAKVSQLPFVDSIDKESASELMSWRSALMSSGNKAGDTDTAPIADGVLGFCGARFGKCDSHAAAAKSVADAIVKRNRPLVYGGGTVGIMGALSTRVQELKGRIKCVIPQALQPREVSGDMIGEVYLTNTMAQRKSVMFGLSSTVVVLPGGLGTFDETLEVLTLIQLNAYRPKLGFLNSGGFFDGFFVFLRQLISDGYVEESIFNYFVVENSDDGEALMKKLDEFVVPKSIACNLIWSEMP